MNYLLVVDDSDDDRHLAKCILSERFDYRVQEASNGWEAIEHIEDGLPLAVITGMIMPEVDGLELTTIVHRRFPRLPVILMTSQGSEQLAAEALARGAADFVPKQALASELCHAVEALLDGQDGLGEQRLGACLRYAESYYELESDLLLVPPLVQQLVHTAQQLDVVDAHRGIQLSKALREAIKNAICHGNLELSGCALDVTRRIERDPEALTARRSLPDFRERRVSIDARISAEDARFVVRDNGPGFDTRFVHELDADPSRLANQQRRGLLLIKTFMDEVGFNDRGNELTMVLRKAEPEAGSLTDPEYAQPVDQKAVGRGLRTRDTATILQEKLRPALPR